jgi:hypothetical protein
MEYLLHAIVPDLFMKAAPIIYPNHAIKVLRIIDVFMDDNISMGVFVTLVPYIKW